VLVVDDDPQLREALTRALELDGYAVDTASNGVKALEAISGHRPDVMVLDVMMPYVGGLDVCRTLRDRKDRLPILVLTARDEVGDRVAGLDAGADDYVVKPFDTDELLARIRALIRRSAGHAEPVFSHKGVTLNPATREASVNGEAVTLSAREWAVLEPMLLRPGTVFSRTQLEEKLYGWKEDISSNAVEVYVHGLRKKLGADLIQTVRGLGYVVPRT